MPAITTEAEEKTALCTDPAVRDACISLLPAIHQPLQNPRLRHACGICGNHWIGKLPGRIPLNLVTNHSVVTPSNSASLASASPFVERVIPSL